MIASIYFDGSPVDRARCNHRLVATYNDETVI